LIDLVIISYGSGELTRSALSAARSFADGLRSVTIVENGQAALPQFGSDVRVERNAANIGYAAAVNHAVGLGSGEFIWLLNPDVASIIGDFGDIRAAFDETVASVTPRLVDSSGVVEYSLRRRPRALDLLLEEVGAARRWPAWGRAKRFRLLDWAYDELRDVDAATGACLFIRRDAWEAIGAFDESFFVYGEETDWMTRARQVGWRHRFVPTVEAVHAGGASTPIESPVRSALLLEGLYKYSRKHFGPARTLFLRSAFLMLDAVRFAAPGANRTRRAPTARARFRVHIGREAEKPS
jgi:N-acetylglucosaminyl-diphospho-decaprenol L-rhamnosyltransferase